MLATNIRLVQIGTTRQNLRSQKWVSEFHPRNNFRGMTGFPQTMDGTTHFSNVDRYFWPGGEFEFNFNSPTDYAACIKIMNGDPFIIRYFDPDIGPNGDWCIRRVRMTQQSLQVLAEARGYHGVINHRFVVESAHAYNSYQDLFDRRVTDGRF